MGVLYTAALPALTDYFHITKSVAQETVSFYLVGCLLGQIIYAPLTNALGRKPAIYIGGTVAIIGSLLCILGIAIDAFSLLLIGRVLTSLGASCGLILTNRILSDAFSFAETKKILSFLMSGYAIFPALSISLGGFITEYISWKGCFYFMLLYSVFVIGLCTQLPETAKEKSLGHLHLGRVFHSYVKQLQNIQFLFYALIVGFAAIILYDFSAEAPFIAKNQLNIQPAQFGLYNLIPNIGLLFGGILAGKLGHKVSSMTLLGIASLFYFLFSITMWILFEIDLINTISLFGMPLLIFFVSPTILSYGQALGMESSTDKTYAASLLYVVQFGYVFISIIVLRFFSPDNASALPIMYSLSGALMILFWAFSKIKRKVAKP